MPLSVSEFFGASPVASEAGAALDRRRIRRDFSFDEEELVSRFRLLELPRDTAVSLWYVEASQIDNITAASLLLELHAIIGTRLVHRLTYAKTYCAGCSGLCIKDSSSTSARSSESESSYLTW